jgi:hypothetical protein
MMHKAIVLAALLAIVSASAAQASMVISTDATQNVVCGNGVCAPTAQHAVLNVDDLEALLSSGDIKVTTKGSQREAYRLFVDGRLVLMKATLTLSATQNVLVKKAVLLKGGALTIVAGNNLIQINNPISDRGRGGVTLASIPFFGPNGKITFSHVSTSLNIAGAAYTLVDSLGALAAAVAANPLGSFALSKSYDAGGDGTYGASPIPTNFLENLEGLGNTIANISVDNTTACCVGGLFQSLSASAVVSSLHLANAGVVSVQGAAGLAYESFGKIEMSSVAGAVTGGGTGDIAGLVSDNYGNIQYSYSAATISSSGAAAGIAVGGWWQPISGTSSSLLPRAPCPAATGRETSAD